LPCSETTVSLTLPFGDDPSRKDQFTIDRSTPPFDLPTILQISRPSKMELFDHSCPNLILTAPSFRRIGA
jgi:hypothetical protein